VPVAEISNALEKKSRYYSNVLFWVVLFVFPLFCIIDFIFANHIWRLFFVLRLCLVIIFYVVYYFSEKLKWHPNLLLYVCFTGISLSMALECSLVPSYDAISTYYLVYSVVFISFNLLVLWHDRNSFFQALIAFIALFGFNYIFHGSDTSRLYQEGSSLFFVIALFSAFIPNLRFTSALNDIRVQLLTEKSVKELQIKNEEINRKNRMIDDKNQELMKLSDQKNNFINMAGYGFKNTVSSVMMSVDMLKSDAENLHADQRELITLIEQSAEKMQETVIGLLDIIQIEAKEIAFSYEVFDVNNVIRNIISELTETARLKNIYFENNFYDHPVKVNLDPEFTREIFHHIIASCIRLSGNNNLIHVSTGIQFSRFYFEINDQQATTSQSEFDHLFNKVKRLSEVEDIQNAEDNYLAISRLLTEAMGGYVIYQASEEEGNYIRIEFTLIVNNT
jgi:signal transduction histidine kinase